MEGARVAAVAFAERALRRQRRAVEAKAEDVGPAALPLRLDPGPGRMDDCEVAAKRRRRRCVSLRRSARVAPQRFVYTRAKHAPRQIGVWALRIGTLHQGEVEALVLIPAGHQWHVALLAGGEDLGRRAWKKPSIDNRTEAESGRGGEDGVSRGCAQGSQGLGSDFAHEVDSDGLGFGEGRRRARQAKRTTLRSRQ